MKSINTLCTLVLTAFVLVFTTSCSKSESGQSARLQVYLTDQPGNYQEVNIDVKEILINYSSDTGKGWVSLPAVRTGVYDILKLTNGNDTLLADAQVQTGRIQQIRLVLGSNNTVRINGQTHNLSTPSAQQSGLKLNIHQEVNEGVLYKLVLDFDASRSVVKHGNNNYSLKPVIRTTVEAIGGSIRGYVTPTTFTTAVYAIRGTDTVAGTSTLNGAYQIRGVDAGTYNLSFVPSDTTYKAQTRTGVTVTTNTVTTVDTVRLVR